MLAFSALTAAGISFTILGGFANVWLNGGDPWKYGFTLNEACNKRREHDEANWNKATQSYKNYAVEFCKDFYQKNVKLDSNSTDIYNEENFCKKEIALPLLRITLDKRDSGGYSIYDRVLRDFFNAVEESNPNPYKEECRAEQLFTQTAAPLCFSFIAGAVPLGLFLDALLN